MDRSNDFLNNQLGPNVAVVSENIIEENVQCNNIEVVGMEFDVGNIEKEVEIEDDSESFSVNDNFEENNKENENDIDYVPENDVKESSSSDTDGEHEDQTRANGITLNQSKEITPKRKRSRRGRAMKDSWEQQKNQIKRSKGQEYFGRGKNEEGKTVFNVKKEAKRIKARCLCKDSPKTQFKCSTISEDDRRQIFERFWSLTRGEKKIFVQGLVERKTVLRRKEDKATFRRNQSLFYYLDPKNMKGKVRVCKKMFLQTLAIGEWAVLNWVGNCKDQCLDDEYKVMHEEHDPINTRKTDSDKSKKILVRSFFESLPKLESHYCRRDSSKLYLEPKWQSKAELYRLYESFCNSQDKGNLKASIFLFYEIFEECNLSLFQPKKDQCDICCAFNVGNLSEQAYKAHNERKETARKEKENDKASADNPDSTIAVFTMDMQAVLLSPDLKASALYYRTKLKVHNFTIFNLNTLDGYCYLWDESEGGLNADEFASILYDFITTQIDKNTCNHVILYSDGCTYQNRNCIIANALLLASQKMGIEITQKFLEKGHTQMECDSMHATIERKLRNREVYSPSAYEDACRTARLKPKPYKVQYLYHDFFKKFSTLDFIQSIRPGVKKGDPVVTDLRCIKYNPNWSVHVKLKLDSTDFMELPRRVKKPNGEIMVPPLRNNRIPIESTKFKHLQELKSVLPRDVHPYYDRLPHFKAKPASKFCKPNECSCIIHVKETRA